ncbi:MAG: exo-alpha-sialidase, partial [Ignavibacteriaceae bacterium]|nr:exo-alpha-sialidase [Ignavibacteriaceae bacterium]
MKLSTFVIVSIFIISIQTQAQVNQPTRFPYQPYSVNNKDAFLLGLPNNNLVMFWYDLQFNQIKYARSSDGGNYWINTDSLVNIVESESYVDINAVVLPSGRVLVTYRSTFYYYVYSDNNCSTWSTPVVLPTRAGILARRKVFQSSLSVKGNGDISFIHSVSQIYDNEKATGIFSINSSDGINWSPADTIDVSGKTGQIINVDPNKDILVYSDSTENSFDLFIRTSTNSGITWSDRTVLIDDLLDQSRPRGVKDQNGKIWIYYNQGVETPFLDIYQSDINFITSSDNGINWSTPDKFTKYVGYDYILNISKWSGRPIMTLKSSRDFNSYSGYFQFYYTIADGIIDLNVPPFMYLFTHQIVDPFPNQPYFIRAFVDDDREVISVNLNTYTNPPGINETVEMFDDGLHNDSLPGDKIYGIELSLPNYGDFKSYNFSITDNDLNIKNFYGYFFSIPMEYALDTYLFDVNNFKFPIDNRGVLGDALINGQGGGRFDNIVSLYSGGFFLSGKNNGSLWINAAASSSLVRDYQQGVIGSSPLDPLNKLYIIKNSDEPFGTSWQDYQSAVEQGADFYDGDDNGIYNPVDLNGNNIWDPDEDMPDLLGDVTAWCVYNDGVPASERRWNDQQPMGIEIQQTVFAWGENVIDPIDNMIFVRYRISNKGTIANKFDDVYFSAWADPDIGGTNGSNDDLGGCDTLLKLGYMYNSAPDPSYGINPPALGIPFLQGASVFIPGETFIDINSNGFFDDSIDVPLDSAFINNGPLIGIKVLPGARNQKVSSFIVNINNDPILNDPNFAIEARNFMLGYDKTGNVINPCNWNYGIVTGGVDCATVDPRFWYSGNPVLFGGYGWINSYPGDQRMLINNGPFTLELDKPIDIIVCYLIGRGSSALNSVTVMKSITEEAIQIYNSNFTDIPTSIENKP